MNRPFVTAQYYEPSGAVQALEEAIERSCNMRKIPVSSAKILSLNIVSGGNPRRQSPDSPPTVYAAYALVEIPMEIGQEW